MIPLPEHYGTEILRSEVGSRLFGTSLDLAQADHDEMGIFIEHPESTIGLKKREHWDRKVEAGEGEQRTLADDTDLIVYSLRKWGAMALGGNPTVILPLFAPAEHLILTTEMGSDLRTNREWIVSKKAGRAFLGYMEQQRQRLTGERGRAGRVRDRGECDRCNGTGEYVFDRAKPDYSEERPPKCPDCGGLGSLPDWKYAMHLMRLGLQGKEFLESGTITLPVPEPYRRQLLEIRAGEVPILDVLGEAALLEVQVKSLLDGGSMLPSEPNADAFEEWMIDAHLTMWDKLTSFQCGIDHDRYCCRSHGTHVMPHNGCLLR